MQAEETLLEGHRPSEFLGRLVQISVSSGWQGRAEVLSGLLRGGSVQRGKGDITSGIKWHSEGQNSQKPGM